MSESEFTASVHYDDSTPSSFTVTGERTRWHFQYGDGTAKLSRVEIRKDDHSTETHVVLFGGEWSQCMAFVETLAFVDEITVEEAL
jgi:hypothetical protein